MRNKARCGRADVPRSLARQGFERRRGPRRRAGFLEIRRDSTAKRGPRGSYPQGRAAGGVRSSQRAEPPIDTADAAPVCL
ncbi:hypothetical protein FFM54_20440 [Burkholderia pseudomallei]|nr:hypothetical protein CXQ84_21205 [Burkholderia pseudomallei]NRD81400.1 hypothetical protein [Burkholderia pseudomallei]NRE46997.1 hypothetical protein [Burkholderia pseudomallei]QCU27448.1 hypothetical protein FE789_03635 [Burkholderia pseudomallei]QCU51895.1 hypothetical protein FFM54_20440 [Burkholderia pseudomallei]